MNAPKLSNLLLAGLLMLGPSLSMAGASSPGSALPPGVNPASPAGGNGGDAQGYDKKPVNPDPAGTPKKVTAAQPSDKNTAPAKVEGKHRSHKESGAKRQ